MHSVELESWLQRIQIQHPITIDLGLERVQRVAERLDLLKPHCPVITVGGTNGKGSTVAGLEAIYLAAGYQVGTFTSPYLFRFNEEIKLRGQEVTDADLIRAFEHIEAARQTDTLTVFEFNTLTALWLFRAAALDIIILEVGLGGRLDAVNIIDADVSIVTTIALDHIDWLGDTREKIGFEKAGIFRAGNPAICGDFAPPESLLRYAKQINAPLFCQDQQFGFTENATNWQWWSETTQLDHLPNASLALQNMASALMAVDLLQNRLPVSVKAIQKALGSVTLTGRIQTVPGDVMTIVDVSHNPASAELLATYLRQHKIKGKTKAVFSMLADKDIIGTLQAISAEIDEWYVAPLGIPRGAAQKELANAFAAAKIKLIQWFDTIEMAYEAAQSDAKHSNRVIVFGSFYTVAQAMASSCFSLQMLPC